MSSSNSVEEIRGWLRASKAMDSARKDEPANDYWRSWEICVGTLLAEVDRLQSLVDDMDNTDMDNILEAQGDW